MKNLKNFTTCSIFWVLSFFFAASTFAGSIPGPELQIPENGATNVAVTPTLMWTSMPNAVTYTLELSADPEFINVVYRNENLEGNSISFGSGFLSNYATYYWRVNYTDTEEITSDWSTPFQFTTVIGVPALLLPANNATGQILTPDLDWEDVNGVESYTLQVSTDPQFETTIINEQGLESSSFTISQGLLGINKQYFWRVKALNSGSEGEYSPAFTFTTYTLPQITINLPVNIMQGADWTMFTSSIINPETGLLYTSLSVPYEFSSGSDLKQGDILVEYFDGKAWINLELTSIEGKLTGTFATEGFPLTPGQTFNVSMRMKADITAPTGQCNIIATVNNMGVIPNEQIAEFTGSFNIELGVPFAPVLVSPINGATSQPLQTALDWEDVINANTYNVELATDPQFLNMVINETGINVSNYTIQPGVLSNSTEYFWRIKGVNTSGEGEYSEVFKFRTIAGDPTIPVLVSPMNGSTGLSLTFTFEWNETQFAESYELQISKDTTFQTPLFEQTGIVTTDYTVEEGVLTNGHWYYWRVRSTNKTGNSDYSEVFSFRTIAATPTVPTLLSPTNGAKEVPAVTTFDWTDVTGSEMYSVQISGDSTFSNIIIDADSVLVSEYTNIDPLMENTTYYWRVNAMNEGGTSEYSSIFQFTTGSSQPPAPVLLTPKNGAVNIELTPTLDWNDAGTELESVYEIELALDEEFTEVIYTKSGINVSEFTVETPLTQNTQHFWRIKFHTQSGSSEWSEAWSFTTTILTGLTNIGSEIPKVYELNQNYPNPFNPTTRVRFGIPQTGNGIQNASLVVYNMLGQIVANLYNGQLTAGMYEVQFDASGLSSGTYFYELRTDNFRSVKRMTLIK
jgi:hypothetical protein